MKLIDASFLLLLTSIGAHRIPDFRITDTELQSLVDRLRRLDTAKARPGQIRLNYQRHTTTQNHNDDAPRNLFTYVDRQLIEQPTFQKFRALLDNYDRDTGQTEYETREERQEIDAFVAAIANTDVGKELYRFFSQKRHPYASSGRVFNIWMRQLWFQFYSRRRGAADTSGFEHVFVGEVKRGQVSGMHNWLQYYLLEKAGSGDYKGFLVKRGNIMAAVKFGWQRQLKPSGSFLIGTSPEFDFALNTICFLTHNRGRQDPCKVKIDGCEMSFTSHVINQRGKDYIGSIYPSGGRMNDACRRSVRNDQ